jgi:hypothetical protein
MADTLKTLMERRMAELEAASNGDVIGVRPNTRTPAPTAPPAPATPRPPVKLRPPSELEAEIQRETEERRKKQLFRTDPPVARLPRVGGAASLKEKKKARKTDSFSDQDY